MLSLFAGFIGGYLLLGLYMVTFGPLGKGLRQEEGLGRQRMAEVCMRLAGRTLHYWQRDIFLASLYLTALLGWPVFLHGWYKSRLFTVEPWRPAGSSTGKPGKRALLFSHISGSGCLLCRTCGYHAHMTPFIHSHRDDGWQVATHQCRCCHQFWDVESSKTRPADRHCPCGGELTRDAPLVCPQCHGDDLYYDVAVVT